MIRSLLLLMGLLDLVSAIKGWHVYDSNLQLDKNICSGRSSLDYVLANKNVEKWKLWPELSSEREGEVIFGFERAMEAVWKNQHPADCSTAKYLIAEGWTQGFGSDVHVVGVGLAIALNTGRVFLMNPNGPLANAERDNTWQTRNNYCAKQKKVSMECYFEAWSSCTTADAIGNRNISDIRVYRKSYFSDTDFANKPELQDNNEKAILLESRGDVPLIFPSQFTKLLSCSQIPPHNFYYWWRAISAAYMLRPNHATLDLIKSYAALEPFDKKRDHCISIYVRRGDKHVEMPLVHLDVYLETAKLMHAKGWLQIQRAPSSPVENNLIATSGTTLVPSSKIIFLGSEDSSVIEQAKSWGLQNNWTILFTNVFDRKSVSAGLNHTLQTHLRQHHQHKSHELEYFSMLLNLHFHAQCEAFVCTMPSNFCRVIDELRSTVGMKANRHIADVSNACSKPPCYDEDIEHYGWR